MFKSQMLKGLFTCAVAIMLSAPASAAFVASDYATSDWKVEGDGQAMLQVSTGKEWLRLNQTSGMSVNDVAAQLSTGGEFEGWRLPTQSEVSDMLLGFFSGFISPEQTYVNHVAYGHNDTYWAETQNMRTRIGGSGYKKTPVSGGNMYQAYTTGYHMGDEGEGLYSGVRHTNAPSGSQRRYELAVYNGNPSAGLSNSLVGVFLVSDGGVTRSSQLDPSMNANNPNAPISNVPVLAIGGLALLGLGLVRRKV